MRLTLADALLAGAVAVAVVAVFGPRPQPAAPRPRPIIVSGESVTPRDRWLIDEDRREMARVERELAAIRASLDHVTVRVHLPGCSGVCEVSR